MNRRNFLALFAVGPTLLLPAPKKPWGELDIEDFKPVQPKFPKMDRFVNDYKVLPNELGPFWLHPCSKVGCRTPRNYWIHNG